jgi:hypothetical protein
MAMVVAFLLLSVLAPPEILARGSCTKFLGKLAPGSALLFGDESSSVGSFGNDDPPARCAKTCAMACEDNPSCYAWAFDQWRRATSCEHYGKGLGSSLTSSMNSQSYWSGGTCARPDQPRQACAATADCAAGYYCAKDGYCYNDCGQIDYNRYDNNICGLAGDSYYCGPDNKCTSGCAAAPPARRRLAASAPEPPSPSDYSPSDYSPSDYSPSADYAPSSPAADDAAAPPAVVAPGCWAAGAATTALHACGAGDTCVPVSCSSNADCDANSPNPFGELHSQGVALRSGASGGAGSDARRALLVPPADPAFPYICSGGTCLPSCATDDDCNYYLPSSYSVASAAQGIGAALWQLCTAGVCGATSTPPEGEAGFGDDMFQLDGAVLQPVGCSADADCAAGAAERQVRMFCASTCLDFRGLVDDSGRLSDNSYLARDRGYCADRTCPDTPTDDYDSVGCAEGYSCQQPTDPDFGSPTCVGSGALTPGATPLVPAPRPAAGSSPATGAAAAPVGVATAAPVGVAAAGPAPGPATDSAPKSAAAARTVHAMALGAAACVAAALLV